MPVSTEIDPRIKVKVLRPDLVNSEFCDPTSPEKLKGDLGRDALEKELKSHGFDPLALANSGLKGKLVAIYPAAQGGTDGPL